MGKHYIGVCMCVCTNVSLGTCDASVCTLVWDANKCRFCPRSSPNHNLAILSLTPPAVDHLAFWTFIRTSEAVMTTLSITVWIPVTSPRTLSERYLRVTFYVWYVPGHIFFCVEGGCGYSRTREKKSAMFWTCQYYFRKLLILKLLARIISGGLARECF